jgi:hypothetical protein
METIMPGVQKPVVVGEKSVGGGILVRVWVREGTSRIAFWRFVLLVMETARI